MKEFKETDKSTGKPIKSDQQMLGENADCVEISAATAKAYQELDDLLKQGDLQGAERLCRDIIRTDSGNAFVHELLGHMLSDQNRNQEAEPLYREAIRLDPNYAPAYNNLGVLLGEQGRFPEAEDIFRKAILIESIDAYANLGYLLSMEGRLAEAQEALLEALSRNPHHSGAQRHLADVSNTLANAK